MASDSGQSKSFALLLTVIAAILAIPGAVIANDLSNHHPRTASPGRLVTTTKRPALTGSSHTARKKPSGKVPRRAAPATPVAAPAPAPPQTAYLSNMNIVGFDYASGTGTNDQGSYAISGTTYGHSIEMDPGCQNSDGGDFWIEYDLGRKWSKFTSTVGPLETDASDAAFSYTVYGDGRVLATGSAALAQPRRLRVNVSGYLRLRLLITDPQSPNRECGFVNGTYDYIWGNATLTQ